MKSQTIRKLLALAIACSLPALAQAQAVNSGSPPSRVTPGKFETPLDTLKFKYGAPSEETVTRVYDYLNLMRRGRRLRERVSGHRTDGLRHGVQRRWHSKQRSADLLETDGLEIAVRQLFEGLFSMQIEFVKTIMVTHKRRGIV